MKYTTYLKNKNLSKLTINTYIRNANKWEIYLNSRKSSKKLFVNYINKYQKNHMPNSTRLIYSSILSYIKFQKKWKLYNEFKDIRLPSSTQLNKTTISLKEFNELRGIKTIEKDWYKSRDWLIFTFLLTTGIRISELTQVNKKNIKNNCLTINGKGNKERIIYICDYLQILLRNWKANRINISKQNKQITNKQANIIIKKIGKMLFDKEITPHSLRRSYATNLLRGGVDIKTVSKMLGHTNINTTSRYIHFSNEELIDNIKHIF